MLKLRSLPRRVGLWLQDKYFARWGRFHVVEDEDLPDEASPGKLYLVGEDGRYWIAAMRCPCGCSTLLEIHPFGAKMAAERISCCEAAESFGANSNLKR
jgi:Family of unknown function (DUF6527)